MKLIRVSFVALVALAVGASVPAFAQHDHDHDSDSRHENNKDNDKDKGGSDRHEDRDHRDDRGHHQDRDRHEVQERHEDHARHEVQEHHEDRDRHEAQERHEDHVRHEVQERHEDRGRHEGWERRDWAHERHEHQEWARRNHRHYIREEHYVAYFGPVHRFRIVRPVIVAGNPRFHYGGYWFVIGRPLPPGWHYSDEVYVDYMDDGYYMCSPVHPGIRISINIL